MLPSSRYLWNFQIMSQAIEWAASQRMTHIGIEEENGTVFMRLDAGWRDFIDIEYERNGNLLSVRCERLNKSILIEAELETVFREDLRHFLVERQLVLSLGIVWKGDELNVKEWRAADNLHIFRCFKNVVELSHDKIRIDNVILELHPEVTVPVILKLNSLPISTIHFKELITIDQFLALDKWNRGKKLYLKFCFVITREKIHYLQAMLQTNHSSFEKISVFPTDLVGWWFEPLVFYPHKIVDKGISFEIIIEKPSHQRIKSQKVHALEVFGNRLIMETLHNKLNLFDIQKLRKVCRDIRTCIDTVKTDPHIQKYSIEYIDKMANVFIHLNDGVVQEVDYVDNGDRWWLLWKNTFCPATCFAHDFNVNTRNQTSSMKELRFNTDNEDFMGKIRDVLKSRQQSLRIETLNVRMVEKSFLMDVLPFVDADILETIKLMIVLKADSRPVEKDHKLTEVELHIGNAPKLIQWKKAKELITENLVMENQLQSLEITSFANVDIKISRISTDDVVYLKEKLIDSSILSKFKISFKQSTIDESLYDEFIPYRRVEGIRCIWYFPMTTPDKFLHILYHESQNSFVFSCVGRDDLPEGLFAV